MNPTQGLKRIWASAPKGQAFYECLTLTHSRFSQAWHLTNHTEPISAQMGSTQVQFNPFPFTIKLPASDAQGGQLLNIVLANAGKDMVHEIESASTVPTERINVDFRIYTSEDLTASQITPLMLSIDQLTMSNESIIATAGRSDVLNQPFPSIYYRPEQFPGLRR